MGKKSRRNPPVTVEEDLDGFGDLNDMGDLFEGSEAHDNGGQGAWGAEANDGWGVMPADSVSNLNVNVANGAGGGAWWQQQQQQHHHPQMQMQQQMQQQHHQQQHHQQQHPQNGGSHAHAHQVPVQAGRMPVDPRLAAANMAAMAMQGHLQQQMPAGSRHEQMLAEQMRMAQLAQLKEQLSRTEHQLAQQHQQVGGHGDGSGRGRKKHKNRGNENGDDPWSADAWGGGGGGGQGAASDPWGAGGGNNQGGATTDPWTAAKNGQGAGDPWGAQKNNANGWNQEATWGSNGNDNSWGNQANGGEGNGAWGEENHAGGGGGGAWGTPMSANQALQNALNRSHRNSHAPTVSHSESWGGWNQAAGAMDAGAVGHGKTPKVTVQAPSMDEARTVLSEKQQLSEKQHSHVFQSLLGALRGSHNQGAHPNGQGKRGEKQGKKSKKGRKQSPPPPSPWRGINVIEEEPEEEFEEDYEGDDGHDNDWYNNAQGGWDDPMYSMPSKAYALAGDGHDPVGMHQQENPYMDLQFIDSRGAALAPARMAFYNAQGRKARERIHWLFNPNKDERVSSLLAWIQQASPQLATYGLNKFLQGRERGALFVNAGYRPPNSPEQPAFDWLHYDQIHQTFDRTLQESIAYYDVHTHVYVFVFLLSKSGNSMAVWRRKLILPNNLRLTFGAQITQAKAGLRKQYPIYLDENPEDVPPLPPAKEKKKRWYLFGR